MIARLMLTGLVLGLSLGPVCALTCAPLLGAALAGEVGRGRRAGWALARFLLGRLIGYAAFGALAGGLLGGALHALEPGAVRTISSAAILVLGIALVVFGARTAKPRAGAVCPGAKLSRLAGLPLLFGLLSGAGPCPPFLLAAAEAVRIGSWLGGLLHFLGFFLGTSVLLVPAMLVAPLAERFRAGAVRLGSGAAIIVGILYALSGVRGLSPRSQPTGPVRLTEEQARLVLPEAARLERRDGSTFEGFAERNALGAEPRVGFAALGQGSGYGGALTVAVGLSVEGKILRAAILAHSEDPGFMAMVKEAGFLEGFRGRSFREPLEVGRDVDAVSGATLSSRGVTGAVRAAGLSLAERGAVGAPATLLAAPSWQALAAAGYLLLVAILLPRLRGNVRRLCLAVSVAVMGVLLGRFFSVADVVRLGTGLVPGGARGAGVILFLAVLLGVTLWRGRVWCSHVCPFGALSELGGWACRARARTPRPLARAARFLPWAAFAGIAGAIAWTGKMSPAAAEPFGATAQLLARPLAAGELWEASPLGLSLAGLLLGLSLLSARFYCRHLCGAGAVLRVISRAGARAEGKAARLEAEEPDRGGEQG